MFQLVPEEVDGAVVCNVVKTTDKYSFDASVELALCLHNWIKQSEVPYLILDLQDEKEVCEVFLAEVLQLRRRLKVPFLFAGVMDRPRRVLEAYEYNRDFPIFVTPEDAVRAIRMEYPGLTEVRSQKVAWGKPIWEPKAQAEGSDFEMGEAEHEAE
jgi:hypothetical protein